MTKNVECKANGTARDSAKEACEAPTVRTGSEFVNVGELDEWIWENGMDGCLLFKGRRTPVEHLMNMSYRTLRSHIVHGQIGRLA